MILDNQQNIEIDKDTPTLTNFQSLYYLKLGLFNIANFIRRKELDKDSSQVLHFGSSDLDLNNWFEWFASSAVNYFRLVMLVDLMTKNKWNTGDLSANRKMISSQCTKYVEQVIPEIFEWRNKVAAHYAITDPYKDDNVATLEASIMGKVSYHRPYYYAGALKWNTKGHSSDLSEWALTKEFDRLTPRFWPENKLSDIKR